MSGRRWSQQELDHVRRLYPDYAWSGIIPALPKRSKAAIRCKVFELGLKRKWASRTPWTGAEIAILRKLYPNAPWSQICKAIPRHPKPAIGKMATSLKIGRDRAMKQSRFAIVRELRAARRASGLRQDVLAKLVGTLPVQIAKWERGETVPRFASFLDWAEALGYRVELRKY